MYCKLLIIAALSSAFILVNAAEAKNEGEKKNIIQNIGDFLGRMLSLPGAFIGSGIKAGLEVGGYGVTKTANFLKNSTVNAGNIIKEKAAIAGNGFNSVVDFGKHSMKTLADWMKSLMDHVTGKNDLVKTL